MFDPEIMIQAFQLVTCSTFPGVDGMAPEKKRVCIGVLELALVAFTLGTNLSLECTEIF